MENEALASEIRPLEDGRSGTEIVGAGGKRVCVCVCVCVCVVVEFHDYRKNTGHYKGANPDAMSEKKCMALFHLAAM